MAFRVVRGYAPLVVFLSLFVGSGVANGSFYVLPACVALLPALLLSVVLTGGWSVEGMNAAVDKMTGGMCDKDVVSMVLIYLLAGAFNAVMALPQVAGVKSVVALLHSITVNVPGLLLPGLFLGSVAVAFAIGTSMGTIASIGPIAVALARQSGASVVPFLGAVVSGATCGDNLSPISDTAIAACNSQKADTHAKMRLNFYVAVPALVLTCISTWVAAPSIAAVAHSSAIDNLGGHLLRASPYLVLILLAIVFKLHVLLVLFLSLVYVIGLGWLLTNGSIMGHVSVALYKGMDGELDIVLTAMFMAGLTVMMQDVLDTTAHAINKCITRVLPEQVAGEIAIGLLVVAADILCANNTVAIIMIGRMAKEIATQHKLDPVRAATVLDVWSCIAQSLLPHGAQLLLIGRSENISPTAIMQYSHYPLWLLLTSLASILLRSHQTTAPLPAKQA